MSTAPAFGPLKMNCAVFLLILGAASAALPEYNIPVEIDDGEDCHIKIKICGDGYDPDTMYLQINNHRILSDGCDYTNVASSSDSTISGPSGPFTYYYLLGITASCKMITYFTKYSAMSFEEDAFIEEVYDTLHKTPYGGYFIMISRGGFQQDLVYLSNATITHQTIMDDLGFVFADNTEIAELESNDDYDFGDVTGYNDTRGDPALAVIYRKSYSEDRLLKTIKPGSAERIIDMYISQDVEHCIEPLSFIDRVKHDPSVYGLNDKQFEDTTAALMHVDLGNKIGCNGSVYAWEYIPASTENAVYFTVGGEYNPYDLRGIHNSKIEESSVTDDLEINYVCHRQHPIQHVRPGDSFGYFMDDASTAVKLPIKMVVPYENSSTRYPCSRQFSWGEASHIAVKDFDLANGWSTDLSGTAKKMASLALRPIFDKEFMYKCSCEENEDCQEYKDFNMECSQGVCECRDEYVYNRRHNRCLFSGIPYNDSEASQSSTLDGLDKWDAVQAVDDSAESRILNGTCAMTREAINPWYVVDLGIETMVYAVEVKTPIPLDVYLDGWLNAPEASPPPDADCFLHWDVYENLTEAEHCERPALQRIDVHGPFPWKIETIDQSDFEILNREYTDGVKTYLYTNPAGSNMGSVGQNTQKVSRIIDFGYIESTAFDSCLNETEEGVVYKLDKDVSEECLGLVVYIEPAEGDDDDYYIRRLSDSHTLKVESFTENAAVSFGSDKTSFQFYSSGSPASFSDVYTSVEIRPTNSPSLCLQFNSADPKELVIGPLLSCQLLYLHEMFDETLPMYKYRQEEYNATVTDDESQNYNITTDTQDQPCYEVFRSKDTDMAQVMHVVESKWLYLVAHDIEDNDDATDSDLIFRSNEVGIRDFHIAVGTYKNDADTFDVDLFKNYTICNSFKGSPLNGKAFTVECKEPIWGRYVAIYLNGPPKNYDKIQLCDVKVLSLQGKAYESYCESDEDCDWFRDSATGDQNMVCTKESADDKYGLCTCDKGYVYHTEAHMCVDIDECREPGIEGDTSSNPKCIYTDEGTDRANGTCVNLFGSYTCECPDGYEYIVKDDDEGYPLRGECKDINEEAISTCGCEGSCTNGVLYEDGYKFVCTCPPGFRLAADGLGCEDIDECRVVTEFNSEGCETEEDNQFSDLDFCKSLCSQLDCDAVFVEEGTCWVFTDCTDFAPADVDTYIYFRKMPAEDHAFIAQCKYDYEKGIALGTFTTEESPAPNGCENSVGSYKCFCPDGYEYDMVNRRCVNINECPGLCEDGCTDTQPVPDDSKYVCDCNTLDGYQLGDDGFSCIDTDECEEGIDDCTSASDLKPANQYLQEPVDEQYQAWCRNTVGSYHCECPPGFHYDKVNKYCQDINECESTARIHECEQQCENTFGNYICKCDEGYELSLNKHSCEDIDECQETPTICNALNLQVPTVISANCVNKVGSYFCVCDEGYRLSETDCVDINECLEDTPCEDHCENRAPIIGGLFYECFCNDPGYILANDSRTCIDLDECEEENDCEMMSNGTCVNTISSYYCVCDEGYHWDNETSLCLDVNECQYNHGMCTDICTNTDGSYRCSCEVGFELTSNHHTCEDIDECERGTSLCTDVCHNTEGSYKCTCHPGRQLIGDKVTCIDINECGNDNGGCEQRCTNRRTEGPIDGPVTGVTCSCFPGYFLKADYRGCGDIDECDEETDNECTQICENTVGSYTCSCHEGFKLLPDGKTCMDVNECAEMNNGGCAMNCTNMVGSFKCSCFTGYRLDANHRTCTDIDECLDNNGDCQQICINMPGSYRCACDGQYVLIDDGFKCSGFNVIEMRAKISLPYIEQYSDTSSPQYLTLKGWLEVNFAELCGNIQLTSRGIQSCKIDGPFFPTTEQSAIETLQPMPPQPAPAERKLEPPTSARIVPSIPRSGGSAPITSQRIGSQSRRGNKTAERVHFKGFEGSIVGFDVVVKSDDIITDKEQGELSYLVSKLLKKNENSVIINGTRVPLVDDPVFINVEEDGSEKLFKVKSPCDFFKETGYCMNGAKCEVLYDSPICKCQDGFTGSRCDTKPSTVLDAEQIGTYSALVGLGVICIFLTIGLCHVLLRKTGKTTAEQLHREPNVYLPNGPVIGWRNGFDDYFK